MSQCRFYEKKFPEIDDVVVVNVRSIADMGAYVHLLEYNNIEGMILLRSVYIGPISTLLSTNLLTYKIHSTKKRASRTPAVRADGARHISVLGLTQPMSPTPWTRPERPHS